MFFRFGRNNWQFADISITSRSLSQSLFVKQHRFYSNELAGQYTFHSFTLRFNSHHSSPVQPAVGEDSQSSWCSARHFDDFGCDYFVFYLQQFFHVYGSLHYIWR